MVHVNRIPHDGQVEKIEYHPGKFVNASLDKALEDNERNAVFMITDRGQRFCVVQIAGPYRQADHLPYSGRRYRSQGTAFWHDLLRVAAGCLSSARNHAQMWPWETGSRPGRRSWGISAEYSVRILRDTCILGGRFVASAFFILIAAALSIPLLGLTQRGWFSVLFMILDEAGRLIKDHVFLFMEKKPEV